MYTVYHAKGTAQIANFLMASIFWSMHTILLKHEDLCIYKHILTCTRDIFCVKNIKHQSVTLSKMK